MIGDFGITQGSGRRRGSSLRISCISVFTCLRAEEPYLRDDFFELFFAAFFVAMYLSCQLVPGRNLRLTAPATSPINVASGKAGVVCSQLYIDARKFCGLACASKRIGLSEMHKMLLRRAA
jgi:hypothetical protein